MIELSLLNYTRQNLYLFEHLLSSAHRQYSTESQQSGNYVTGNSIKEKSALQPKIGEKLIEVEKAETGSVRESFNIYIYIILNKNILIFDNLRSRFKLGKMESVFPLFKIYRMVPIYIYDSYECCFPIIQYRIKYLAERMVK